MSNPNCKAGCGFLCRCGPDISDHLRKQKEIRAQALLDTAQWLEVTMASESHDPQWYFDQLRKMAGDLLQ